MIVELEILFHNDSTSVVKDLGIDYDLRDCDTRKMTFYHINAIGPYYENDIEYTSIMVNGSEYVCPLSYKQVKAIVDEKMGN